MIFNLLDVPELLECSLVSKKWRAAAASVLFKHKKCFAYIEEPCCHLEELDDALKQTNFQMINGIYIRATYCCEDWTAPDGPELKKLLPALINWPFGFIDVDLPFFNNDKGACEFVMRLTKEIFWTSRSTVRQLAIGFENDAADFFRQAVVGEREDGSSKNNNNVFPDLKSIEFYWDFPSDIYDFVHFSAPSLIEIKGEVVELGVVKSWNEPALRALKSVSVTPEGTQRDAADCVDYKILKKFASFETSLHHFRINDKYYRDEPENEVAFPSSWLNSFAQIFRNSRGTLKNVEFCASEFMKIMMQLESTGDGTLVFPNIRRLKLDIPEGTGTMVDRSILRRMKIGTCFPQLRVLITSFGQCCHDLEGEEYEGDYGDIPASDLSPELEIRETWPCWETFEYFVNTFPHLTSLVVDLCDPFTDREHVYSLSNIFSSFPHLQHLKLDVSFSVEDEISQCFSLDAIFCGINFEEVQKIQLDCQSTGLDLKNMKIVPLRPGLTSAASNDNILR